MGLNDTTDRSSPVQVGALADWAQVGGGLFTVAAKKNGTLWSWGSNFRGELGRNDTTSYSSPVQVGALTDWSKISAGGDLFGTSVLAIKTNGTLWSWGSGIDGGLGQNNTTNYSSPVQVGALSDWAQISTQRGIS